MVSRREFLKILAVSVGAGLVAPKKLIPQAASSWNLFDHYTEWMTSNDFVFPFDETRFMYAERVMFYRLRDIENINASKPSRHVRINGPLNEYVAEVDIKTVQQQDLELKVSNTLEKLGKDLSFKKDGVNGTARFRFSMPQGNEVYYQLFSDKKPAFPVRRFLTPNNPNFNFYSYGDPHTWEGYFDAAPVIKTGEANTVSGIKGRYLHHMFKRAVLDPQWYLNPTADEARMIQKLPDTFHLANMYATIVRRGIHPGMIINGGDYLGSESNRRERQGLTGLSLDQIAQLLWAKERKCDLLAPNMPSIHVMGNHDGEQQWDPIHSYVENARMEMARQPEPNEHGSDKQNYFSMFFAGGDIQFLVLDIAKYSGGQNGGGPSVPQDYKLGDVQFAWLEKELAASKAKKKIIVIHHVAGGMGRNSDGTKIGAYGRGDLVEYIDYLNDGQTNIDAIQQPEITALARKYKVSGIIYNHDHGFFHRSLGDMWVVLGGCPGNVDNEADWWLDTGWQNRYGNPSFSTPAFISAPSMTHWNFLEQQILLDVICCSYPNNEGNRSNIKQYRPGNVIRNFILS